MKRTGKLPPKLDERSLLLSSYTAKLSAPPARSDRYSRVERWPMYGNDRLSDCTVAAAAHMVQSWTAFAGREETPASNAIEAAYFEMTGGRDAGAYCLDVLKRWRKTGIAGDRITAFVKIRNASVEEAKRSIQLFGSCYIGLALPQYALATKKRWNVWPEGPRRVTNPKESNGHCVCAVGYDEDRCYVVTWGRLKAMTWAFYQKYMDEAYAVLDRDWTRRDARAPSGFSVRALQRDLKMLERP